MIIGNGLIANGFNNYATDNSCLIFASGVSNSFNTDAPAFDREKSLLLYALKEHAFKTFVYFSTCSIYDQSLISSPYVQHKYRMEELVRQNHKDFIIFRISNLAGNTNNPHTVLNFFVQRILNGTLFYIWQKAARNIIDISDAYTICSYIITQKIFRNDVVNIANPANYPVIDIVRSIETILGKKGNYEFVDKESVPVIDTKQIEDIIEKLAINFDEHYLEKTIRKYFS